MRVAGERPGWGQTRPAQRSVPPGGGALGPPLPRAARTGLRLPLRQFRALPPSALLPRAGSTSRLRHVTFRPSLGSHDFVATRLKVFFRADLVPTFRACSPVPIGPLSRNLSVLCVSANIYLVSALYFGRPSSPLGYYFVLVSTAAFCVRTIRE